MIPAIPWHPILLLCSSIFHYRDFLTHHSLCWYQRCAQHTQRKNLTHLFILILDIPLTKESPNLIYLSKIKCTQGHSSAVGCNEHTPAALQLLSCMSCTALACSGKGAGMCQACTPASLQGLLAEKWATAHRAQVCQHIQLTSTKGSKGLRNILYSVPVRFGSREHAAGSTQHVTSKEPLKKTSFDFH